MAMRRELLDLFVISADDYLDRWFESDPIKAAYGFDSAVGNYASPYTAGSAYVLLHHVFGEVNGRKGCLGACDRRHGCDFSSDGLGSHRAGR
jgi:phytoene dehydrogenase-like protein